MGLSALVLALLGCGLLAAAWLASGGSPAFYGAAGRLALPALGAALAVLALGGATPATRRRVTLRWPAGARRPREGS